MTVRPARHDDTEGVLAVWGEARSAAAVTPDTPESIERLVERGTLFVAEVDARIVGALIAGWDGWRGNMYRLAVLASHRRRGIARALVEAGHDRLRELGAPRVTALVDHDDEPALELWRATGYGHDPTMGRFVRDL
jgi:ribosomal protein S18 acetylase RimI-like enzyme